MKVQLPASLRERGGPGVIDVDVPAGATLRVVVDELGGRYPTFTDKLLDQSGHIHSYVTFYLNGDDVRLGEGLNTKVSNQDEIIIVPAISGGAGT